MERITIGRDSSCDVVINDERISRNHLEIALGGAGYMLTDHSTNGTYVNGVRVQNQTISINDGANVLLSGKVPLPWDKVHKLLNGGAAPFPAAGPMPNYMAAANDKLDIGWGILAFLIPIVGIIMYFSWKDQTPNKAKTVLLVALVSIGISVIGYIAWWALWAGTATAISTSVL